MSTGPVPLVATLRRLMQPPPAPGERCELCGAPVPPDHGHVVDAHSRRLLCACTACGAVDGRAADARYRSMPGRILRVPEVAIPAAHWDALDIPVGLAFFFVNSRLGRTVGLYPGPAGATESDLPLDAWAALEAASPAIGTMAPDVEALLVRRTAGGYVGFVVPVDACYELVGRIRAGWRGMSGGQEVQDDIDRFFAALSDRSSTPPAGGCP
jgi:hypothetical protein